jgi:hypothetical protein
LGHIETIHGKNVCKITTQLIKNLVLVVHACHPSYVRSINRRTEVQAYAPTQDAKPKELGNMAQVAKHLPGKSKALC